MGGLTGRDRLLLAGIAPAAVAAPLLETLGTLELPLLVPPSLWLFVGLLAVAAMSGMVAALLAPPARASWIRRAGFVAAVAAVLLVAADVIVGTISILTFAAPWTAGLEPAMLRRALRLAILVMPALLVACLFLRWGRVLVRLLFVSAMAFLASSLVLNVHILRGARGEPPIPASTTDAHSTLPAFVYIVLDEAMGTEGVAVSPGGAGPAGEMKALFSRHGFRLHGGAFSRHYMTRRSLPAALNFDFADNAPGLEAPGEGPVSSRLFKRLDAAGYDVISYSTSHLDFCFPYAARCEVLPSFNPYSGYLRPDAASGGRMAASPSLQASAAIFFMRPDLDTSVLAHHYLNRLAGRYEPLPADLYTLDQYMFVPWLERFGAEIRSAPRGRAYFLHVLMPHAPHIFDESCRETGTRAYGYYLGEQQHLEGAALDERRARVYAAYHRQYACTLSALDELLESFVGVAGLDDATIVVHGDHGPRISAGMLAESLSDRDLVDNHSALFAIRGPGIAAGYDTRKTSIQRLIAEYLGGATREALGPDNVTVVNDSRDHPDETVVEPMPDFGDAR